MDKYFCWFGLPGSMVLTTLLSSFALIRALCDPTPIRFLCFAAMALSSIGDLFLARLKPLKDRFRNCFSIGAAFFMGAHLVYAVCFSMKGRALQSHFWNAGTLAALLLGAVVFLAFFLLLVRYKRTDSLLLIVIYLICILLNCTVVFSYGWSAGLTSFSAICAVLGVFGFLLSDLIIGLGLVSRIHRLDFLIWWLYPIGQTLLILGA